MYSLPDILAARFRLYINVLKYVERSIMYILFGFGCGSLLFALYKCITSKASRTVYSACWIEDDLTEDKEKQYKPEKRSSMTAKELEVYFSSLVTPLNQEIEYDELSDIKDEIL